ncbi:MAG: tRNA (adenosine(37)-N6)-dimethylallyltransferase MiaA [Candidatus Taylorbacteria bacterium RIFCSPHIGHO2_01_FULL_45_63]|uniref:tRNA dimethylallyltransferase n=1 Tax=Candidatus Taylorbacteria bacterium RIFCSPHIGHO2_02_FULL_45_35 TaxID=1802311 RepID=A0A1G2MTX0_9BACT|nr:MAG: tRNA (adenosine(37)-N6)-dimethylallyltransferase MiaA [Candidatus Taylorbacteria bacterium RIFCSPHIGHO2_01_FULL_45_63]OHA27293.1 MAG: tRNA (adenosine(37)-N6)-dimethylallyltransferase MiaA [Candidatus Taylorbacteria bacterium RIFCSPHIGHO2_02_FULL_45_35]OHA34734.1 MAG: tRNA (adenosine(37)-N6)-dimethylallyltransferase MiaA [Candidatus Taylorbacteria bacterium RIFCSPLOWO2_01_FULL_45_34b]
MQTSQKILVIVGQTATGKSSLAVKFAKKLNGEVISADSRQVYKGLDIGTGKITKKEMRAVPHHLLDIANPKKRFTVVEYAEKARPAIAAIAGRDKLPIIVGGTGFYISALVDGVVFPDVPPNPKFRKQLAKKSASELFGMLRKLDANRAKNIDPKNIRRLIRAIEIAKNAERTRIRRGPDADKMHPPYNTLFIGLTLPKEELQKRIHHRLLKRLKQGMIKEAQLLHKKGLLFKRMEELGLEYRYLALYLKKQISKTEMIEKLETEIWRYARRQMTWFKRDKRIRWFSPTQTKQIKSEVKRFLV